jgi:hypothetical protein
MPRRYGPCWEAAYGLPRRDDPRLEAAIDRGGPLNAAFDEDHRAIALSWWRKKEEEATAGRDQDS